MREPQTGDPHMGDPHMRDPHTRGRTPLRLVLLAVGLAVGLGVGACVSMGGGGDDPFATLVVQNDGTSIVTVYAVRDGGSRVRVGQVSALSEAEFPLRRHMLGGSDRLQLLIDPLGSRQAYPSDTIHVDRDDVIELRVSSLIR